MFSSYSEALCKVVSFAENFFLSTEFVNKKRPKISVLQARAWAQRSAHSATCVTRFRCKWLCRYYATKKCKKIFCSLWHSMNLDEIFRRFSRVGKFLAGIERSWSGAQGSVTCLLLQRKECNWPKNLDCRSLTTAKMDQPHLILNEKRNL